MAPHGLSPPTYDRSTGNLDREPVSVQDPASILAAGVGIALVDPFGDVAYHVEYPRVATLAGCERADRKGAADVELMAVACVAHEPVAVRVVLLSFACTSRSPLIRRIGDIE